MTATIGGKTTPSLERRMDYRKAAPGVYEAMMGLERHIRGGGLEHSLIELLKIRASQINRCAYCLEIHTRDARKSGETEQRLHLLAAWREAPIYTERERAALAWTEALTLLSQAGVPEELYAATREYFSETELANLTLAVVAINGWNRIAVSFGLPPGS